MSAISYRAPAKVILSGEHAVVYGKPAVVSGFGLYCTLTLHPGSGKNKLDSHMQYVHDVVLKYIQKTNPKLTAQPFRVQIKNDIPVGRGLGSSAALSVAFVACLLQFYTGTAADKDTINSLAYQAEKHFHGNPSGADNTACCFGGLIFYRKEFEFLKTISALNCKLPKHIEEHLFLIDTGKPAEGTAEMVKNVSMLYNSNSSATDSTMCAIEKTTKRLVVSVIKEDAGMFRDCIEENGKLLMKLEVVSEKAKSMLQSLGKYGVGKITGAGGSSTGSGFLLFYAHNPDDLIEHFNTMKISYYPFIQDYSGVTAV